MATLKIGDELQNVIKKVVLDTYFPVGSIYLTVGNENPSSTIGGTWEKLYGGYLYAAQSSIGKTSYTGWGTQSTSLTIDQMPSHYHTIRYGDASVGSYITVSNDGKEPYNVLNINSWNWTKSSSPNTYANTVGGGQGHTHNIATVDVFAWKRTS